MMYAVCLYYCSLPIITTSVKHLSDCGADTDCYCLVFGAAKSTIFPCRSAASGSPLRPRQRLREGSLHPPWPGHAGGVVVGRCQVHWNLVSLYATHRALEAAGRAFGQIEGARAHSTCHRATARSSGRPRAMKGTDVVETEGVVVVVRDTTVEGVCIAVAHHPVDPRGAPYAAWGVLAAHCGHVSSA